MLFSVSTLSVPKTGDSLFIPFGGRIATYFPACLAPAGIAVSTVGAAPRPLMYIPGASFSYSFGPPARPGQNLLGMASVPVPCITLCGGGFFGPVPCPYAPQPFGFAILYHGSSNPAGL